MRTPRALTATLLLCLPILACCGTKKGKTTSESKGSGKRIALHVKRGDRVLSTFKATLRATWSERRQRLDDPGTGVLIAFPRERALGVFVHTAVVRTDVVLLDGTHQVRKVAADLRAGTLKPVDVIPKLYRYALVLRSGDAARHHLAQGVKVIFALPKAAQPRQVLTPVTLQPPRSSAVTVHAELALSRMETSMGLMYRRYLPPKGGMLFQFARPQVLQFWMRNTLIPLDMIFINDQRVVTGVVHRAKPLDETNVGVGPVKNRYVLEVRGGFARSHGIGAGTRVTFRLPE